MAAMAREFQPLVGHYERLGRLRTHVADALDYLAQAAESYDFVIADLAVDGDSLGLLDSSKLIRSVTEAASATWFRVFGSLPDGDLDPFLDHFDTVGVPVNWLVSPMSVAVPLPRTRDWILASGVPQLPEPDAFVPYRTVRAPHVDAVREAYRKIATRAVPAVAARRIAAEA